ncbi:uncharacterized protein [Pyxicephalus adspersus]|uniref:BEN domain-containing protein n=1 Tax=Pyxicephalus adspersus TaxID=30357 RepID=A0AAV3ADC2_PYXAD|nr:TPA: hypothetical protein GDO54_013403 [Pyxicephalus adspersus]
MDRSAEFEQRQDTSDDSTVGTPLQCFQNGISQPIQMPKFLSTPVMQNSDEDTSARKRQKVFNGPLCSPIIPQHIYVTKQDSHRTNERFSSRNTVLPEGHGIPEEHYWATRSSSRVTSLYAELVRELETQVAELRQILVSRDEAVAVREWRIKELEKENQELKRHIQTLEEQNDALSHTGISATNESARVLGSDGHCVVINDNNISFLRNLAGFLESSYSSQSSTPQLISTSIPNNENKSPSMERLSSPAANSLSEPDQPNSPAAVIGSPPEGMLRVSGVTSDFQYWMKMDDGGENTIPESCVLWEEPLQETLPDGTPTWASPIESNGRPKLELVPSSGVFITYQQLEDLSHIPPDKPKLMTRRLLDYFFSRETLARSSATGQRIAHNNTTMEKPLRLPDAVVTAIKAYVTRACGRGCNFNAVINSKCGTSRRAVKKMSIRIDWTEGGAKQCPKSETSPAQRLQCHSEKAQLFGAKGTDPPFPHVMQTS